MVVNHDLAGYAVGVGHDAEHPHPDAATILDGGRFEPGIDIAILAVGLVTRLKAHYRARSAEFGLTAPEADLMLMLHSCAEPLPMRRIAEKLEMDPSNLTNLVARLEARGLVARQASPSDRRAKLVALSPEGAARAGAFLSRLAEGNPAVAGLGPEEITQLRALLVRVSTPAAPSLVA